MPRWPNRRTGGGGRLRRSRLRCHPVSFGRVAEPALLVVDDRETATPNAASRRPHICRAVDTGLMTCSSSVSTCPRSRRTRSLSASRGRPVCPTSTVIPLAMTSRVVMQAELDPVHANAIGAEVDRLGADRRVDLIRHPRSRSASGTARGRRLNRQNSSPRRAATRSRRGPLPLP